MFLLAGTARVKEKRKTNEDTIDPAEEKKVAGGVMVLIQGEGMKASQKASGGPTIRSQGGTGERLFQQLCKDNSIRKERMMQQEEGQKRDGHSPLLQDRYIEQSQGKSIR